MDTKPSFGDRAADFVVGRIGTWRFVITQNCFYFTWCMFNSTLILGSRAWDPYPWILLNLMLSFQAAQTGPIILISTRRQEELQRLLLRQMYDTMKAVQATVSALITHIEAARKHDSHVANELAELRKLAGKIAHKVGVDHDE